MDEARKRGYEYEPQAQSHSDPILFAFYLIPVISLWKELREG